MRKTRAREGDFVETSEHLIFDVKGLIHPPDRIISFLRYVPASEGDRERNGVHYRKIYDLERRWDYLRKHYPEYVHFDDFLGRELQSVPLNKLSVHHEPKKKLKALLKNGVRDQVERDAVELAEYLAGKARISTDDFGISGSLLVGLQRPDSDIDPVVYGSTSARRVYETLRSLLSSGGDFKRYDMNGLGRLFRSRSMESAVKFDAFCIQEQRKVLQGKYRDRDYFIRCIRDWDEVVERYGDCRCRGVGRVKVSAVVSDDEESILTPCVYSIDDVRILEGSGAAPDRIISFRGRFCEQARKGEKLIASGTLEEVTSKSDRYHQLVAGESPSDFILKI